MEQSHTMDYPYAMQRGRVVGRPGPDPSFDTMSPSSWLPSARSASVNLSVCKHGTAFTSATGCILVGGLWAHRPTRPLTRRQVLRGGNPREAKR